LTVKRLDPNFERVKKQVAYLFRFAKERKGGGGKRESLLGRPTTWLIQKGITWGKQRRRTPSRKGWKGEDTHIAIPWQTVRTVEKQKWRGQKKKNN